MTDKVPMREMSPPRENKAPSESAVVLFGTPGDVASLALLAIAWSQTHDVQWISRTAVRNVGDGVSDGPSRATFLTPTTGMLPTEDLRERGVPVWNLTQANDALVVEDDATTWTVVQARSPASLAFTVPPMVDSTDQNPANVAFFVDAASDAAHTLLTRLLRLGSTEIRVSPWNDAGRSELLVEVGAAPHYLVRRAFEEPQAGVCAFASFSSNLWIEWSFAHPLAALLDERLAGAKKRGYVDRNGIWRMLPATDTSLSIYDVIAPSLDATPATLAPAPLDSRIPVRMRLENSEQSDPELWLIDAETFFRFGDFLLGATPAEAARLSVARLTHDDGRAIYLVRERAQADESRMGVSLSAFFQRPGFSRLEGTNNFFLPVGRRLRPQLRRDDLRNLLGLDVASVVILEEADDGLRLTSIAAVEEFPISQWLDLAATDQRRELDRLLEDAVLTFPAVSVETPPKPLKETRSPPRAKPERVERPARQKPAPIQNAPTAHDDDPGAHETEAILALLRPLESEVTRGGNGSADTWISIAHYREALGDEAQAATCFENGIFYRGEPSLAAALAHQDSSAPELVRRLMECRLAPNSLRLVDDEEFLDRLTQEHKTSQDAQLLGALVLERLLQNDAVAIDALPQIVATFRDRELPVSHRLCWSVLLACHLVTQDSLGLTRAKETVLGALNASGLNEAFDVPRFIRLELALDENTQSPQNLAAAHLDQFNALESLWDSVVGNTLEAFDVDAAYLRAQFGIGFARLGAMGNARAIVRPLEEELPAHDAPNRALLSLYLGRLAHESTRGTPEAWAVEVNAALNGIDNIRVRRTVEWLRKRSKWLHPEKVEAPPPWIRPEFERQLAAAESSGEGFVEVIQEAFRARELYDYELASTIERMVTAAMTTGVDAVLSEVVDFAQTRLPRIQILGHRAAATGACIRAAAALGDAERVDKLLLAVIEIAQAPNVPSMRALLAAVEPALVALRRLGASASGIRFLDALETIEVRSHAERVKLLSAISDGLMTLESNQRPYAMIDQCIDVTLRRDLDHVGRFEAAVAIVSSLHHWPLGARTERCRVILEDLATFRDTFTTNTYFRTHRVLLCEAIIDAMSDLETLHSDRVHAFLDAEEQQVRQVIAADWSAVCGR